MVSVLLNNGQGRFQDGRFVPVTGGAGLSPKDFLFNTSTPAAPIQTSWEVSFGRTRTHIADEVANPVGFDEWSDRNEAGLSKAQFDSMTRALEIDGLD